jgi:hypothetical protein
MAEDKIKLKDLRPGKTVKINDGKKGKLRGVFLSHDGLMLRVKMHPDNIADRSVRAGDVEEIT